MQILTERKTPSGGGGASGDAGPGGGSCGAGGGPVQAKVACHILYMTGASRHAHLNKTTMTNGSKNRQL